ncbi:hypothetical protein CI109_106922 [Kwoniella shandongensis]|uniref:Uncharacterized protein n=1 Tax=Kwoniella shandongensis TaxID=1734106 RepID=A0A5M6C6J6_9TREE|nr:uncharacterized protein CI109_000823 [Kwoniella shandongensis]KAA5530643.1 hypothetical protein CI109_000823 [Kwoniella shandongensis]
MTSRTKVRSQERTFYHFHCDPQHDFIIKSDDYVYFRASRFHLARVSTVFADMFTIASSDVGDDHWVALDQSSEVIGLFLDLVHSPKPTVPTTEVFDTARSLLEMTQFYMCDDEVLDLAEQYQDASHGDSQERCEAELKKFVGYLDELGATWAYELLRNLLTAGRILLDRQTRTRYGFFLTPNWASIASYFDPDRLTKSSSKLKAETGSKKRKMFT